MITSKIKDVQDSIISYLELAETMLSQTMDNAKKQEWEKVKEVIDTLEPQANQLKITVANKCLGVLALFHPEAGDLRAVVKMSGMASDLERMGDMATKIARANYYWKDSFSINDHPIILEMYDEVRAMLKDVASCFKNLDSLGAIAIIQRDDIVDELCTKNQRIIIKKMSEGGSEVESLIQVMNITRNLERMADLCGHLAEDIIFIKEGSVIQK
ncbi:MAG: phosphate signaling complex protein PhoU [Brevinema sp.]